MVDSTDSTPAKHPDCVQVGRIKNYAWYITAAWTMLLLASAVLTTNKHKETLN